jgi:hypothetical protein
MKKIEEQRTLYNRGQHDIIYTRSGLGADMYGTVAFFPPYRMIHHQRHKEKETKLLIKLKETPSLPHLCRPAPWLFYCYVCFLSLSRFFWVLFKTPAQKKEKHFYVENRRGCFRQQIFAHRLFFLLFDIR